MIAVASKLTWIYIQYVVKNNDIVPIVNNTHRS